MLKPYIIEGGVEYVFCPPPFSFDQIFENEGKKFGIFFSSSKNALKIKQKFSPLISLHKHLANISIYLIGSLCQKFDVKNIFEKG